MLYIIFIVLLFSIVQASVSTFLSIALALPVAHFLYLYNFTGKRLVIALACTLCIMPTKLVALCVQLFFGTSGFVGIILAHLMLNIPLALYIISSTYEKLDITLIWLAADSGASSWQCYRDIIFPLLKPTIISIALLLFLLHFASFSIPLLLGSAIYHHTPEIMMYNMHSQGNSFFMFLFWLIRLLVIIPLFFAYNKYSHQKIKTSSAFYLTPKPRYKLFKNNPFWLIYGIFIFTITLGPLVSLLIKAVDTPVLQFFASLFSFFPDKTLGIPVSRVIFNSLLLAFVSGIGSVLMGFILGALEFALKNKVSKVIVSFLTISTFFVGSVGVGMLFAYLSYGKFISSFAIGVLCHMILNFPFAYRIIRAQMVLYHPDLHKTAQTFGVTFKRALLTIAVPFIFPALLCAFCISFGLSLTEVGAGSVLQGKIGLTMPMAIRIYRKSGDQHAVIGLSVILLFLVLCVTYLFSKEP